jgi:ADP-dependent NAD(P)H-hydrate dehydratase
MQPDDEPPVETVTTLPALAPRAPDSNKGDFGKVLVVAGSRGMSGAAVLSGSAALRGGAGLVRVAVPLDVLSIVAAGNPCYITAPLPHDEQGRLAEGALAELLSLARAHTVLAVGPGLGRSPGITALLSALLGQVETPVVLDADGLNAFDEHPERLRRHKAPLILTPHPGEFARLVGLEIRAVQARRQSLAVRYAAAAGAVLVLKGYGTLVTDGKRVYRNETGNAGMATAGSGDVLTGLVAALLGQGLEPFAAAQLGVYLHGLAGDLARDEVGEPSLIASDLLHYLPRAFLRHQG